MSRPQGLQRLSHISQGSHLSTGSAQSGSQSSRTTSNVGSKRFSASALYSILGSDDVESEDELARAQRRLRELKAGISALSKKNFLLERDVTFLDGRIALLIQNRMAWDEQNEVAAHLEDLDRTEETSLGGKRLAYSNLFFLLQSEPRHMASLCRLVSLAEIDTLLQTVMFTLYGNQYESREEHLLLTMFQSVLQAQFESAVDVGSLLRANTPVSRMMTTYTRRGPGQAYLKSVLAHKISAIIENASLNLEINPIRVAADLDAPEQDKEAQVQALIASRTHQLMQIAQDILTTIIDSIESVPYGIRWICKQIRLLSRRKYPDAEEHIISSLIGGFFFLRFINPAIVTPQAYMLVDTPPERHPKRVLTLLAKMLQNLANKPSYAKEAYMAALNPFVESHKAAINTFFNDLCLVGDFGDTLELDQYKALSRKDLAIQITLNEMYNTHALLMQHLNDVAPLDSPLRSLLDSLGPAPAQVSRKDNKVLELALVSKWETPIADLQSALVENASGDDILFLETKNLFIALIRSLGKQTSSLSDIAQRATNSRDPALVKKGIKATKMLRILSDKNMDNQRGYALQQEVDAELIHLGNIRETVIQEITSLQDVLQTINEHNKYLRAQLGTYKDYLRNAREASSRSRGSAPIGVVVKGKKPVKVVNSGPFEFSHAVMEREGVIAESHIPKARQKNVIFVLMTPSPGAFIIALNYIGREKPMLEMDFKLDDLLEKQREGEELLDLECVKLDVKRLVDWLRNRIG